MKFDRWKLEHGSARERIWEVYAISQEDIASDPSIVAILRENLTSEDNDLLEISIMRMSIRAKDTSSIDRIVGILRDNQDYLVRAASIAALSSLYQEVLKVDPQKAQSLLSEVRKLCLNARESQQVECDFLRDQRRTTTGTPALRSVLSRFARALFGRHK